jgi:hypothetical protein
LTKHDLGASVRARLLNQAHAQKRPFQELLQYYSMERFLYRLSRSRNAEQFVLKATVDGLASTALTLHDGYLLERMSNQHGHIRALIAKICEFEAERDGIEFDAQSIKVARIKEDAEYEGVRVRFHATLARPSCPTFSASLSNERIRVDSAASPRRSDLVVIDSGTSRSGGPPRT